MHTPKIVTTFFAAMVICSLGAASVLAQDDPGMSRPSGWDDSTHGSQVEPDYAVVFPQDAVNTLTITVSAENWRAMQDDMTGLYGEFGTREQGRGGMERAPGGGAFVPGEGAQPPARPEGGQPPAMRDRGPGMGGMILGSGENPMWIPVDITFNDQTWTTVGFRLKGNSSLMSTWGAGAWKLPFKLDFDEFEDTYPEIENQRFFGFKQLSFSSNWSDASLLREKVTADIFRAAGVPSAQTAFYAVYVDYGEGPVYFGLYTAVEVIDDTVIQTQFADDSGNVYKPEGTGATFAAGTFNEASFDKETNTEEDDYSDILALFDALHAETRTTDPAAWRAGVEAVFDVDGFMRWLAVNSVIQNWDTYGRMAHNYYLYTDPTTGLITWIPWDNNMALMAGMRGGMGGRGARGGVDDGLSLDLEGVTADWPLIRFLMDDPVYHTRYSTYVQETIEGAFEPTRMAATYQQLHDLIAPYVVGENGEQAGYTLLNSSDEFETALAELINHVNQRYATAQEYLASQQAAE